MLTVRTRIKEIMEDSKLGIENISRDYLDRIDEKVKQLIMESLKRAKENGRKTVMGKDV
jgi:histone H3/H4